MSEMVILGSGYEWVILLAIVIGIVVPLVLFIIGLVQLRKHKKRGQLILIIAAVYSLISFGMCGGFGF